MLSELYQPEVPDSTRPHSGPAVEADVGERLAALVKSEAGRKLVVATAHEVLDELSDDDSGMPPVLPEGPEGPDDGTLEAEEGEGASAGE
jgi:hypothetical protein